MEIHDCYDPVRQAERREAKWDRYLAKFPVCAICRKVILPGSKLHAARCATVCSSCMELLNDNCEIIEEEQ